MEKFYESAFINISYLTKENIVKAIWSTQSNLMKAEDFKTSIEHIWKAVRKYKPKGFLGDTRQFLFTVDLELQEWYGQNIGDTFGTHTKKIAMLVASEFIPQISIEQTIEEDKSAVQTQFFDEELKAISWILAD